MTKKKVRSVKDSDLRAQLVAVMRAKGFWVVRDLSARLLIGESAIYKWIAQDRVEHCSMGNNIYIKYSSLENVISKEILEALDL